MDAIRVEGLAEFRRSLRQLDGESHKALRLAINKALATVVTDAQARVPVVSGRAKASIKAQSTQTQGRIKAGSAKVAYFGWLDFGGTRGRPYIKKGRYVWRSFGDNKKAVMRDLYDALIEVAERAGLEVG